MENVETLKQEMYDFMKNLYEEMSIDWAYDLARLYNEFAGKYLEIEFWVDGQEYGDGDIYCYIYVNGIWSIVYNWSCGRYEDPNFYKDTVNYLLNLDKEGQEIKEKLISLTSKNNSNENN